MGTNYYLHTEACSHCGRSDPPRHIGKSSAGWCFALRIYPDDGINGWAQWESLIHLPNAKILDEYGRTIPPEEMVKKITKREWSGRAMTAAEARRTGGEPGPNNLLRHCDRVSRAHEGGTWDLVEGEFS